MFTPITATPNPRSYVFGTLCMLAAAGIRLAINKDTSVFVIPTKTIPGLAYAVFISSSLCYGLITWCNKYVTATIVTSFWPLQVRAPWQCGFTSIFLPAQCLGALTLIRVVCHYCCFRCLSQSFSHILSSTTRLGGVSGCPLASLRICPLWWHRPETLSA